MLWRKVRESPRIAHANCGGNEPVWVPEPKPWRRRPDYALPLQAEPQGLAVLAGWGPLRQDLPSRGRERLLSSRWKRICTQEQRSSRDLCKRKNPGLFPDWLTHLLDESVGTKRPSQYSITFKGMPATSSFIKRATVAERSGTRSQTPPRRDATCMLMPRVFVHSLAASTVLRQFPWCCHGALSLHLHLSAFPTHPPPHNMLLAHPERSAIVMMILTGGRLGGQRVKRWALCSNVRGNRGLPLCRTMRNSKSSPRGSGAHQPPLTPHPGPVRCPDGVKKCSGKVAGEPTLNHRQLMR